MKKIRWSMTAVNITLVLALGAMGMYYFGGLGIFLQRMGIDRKYCPGPYFADADIPTWNPGDYVRKKGTETRKRTLERDYPYIAIPIPVIRTVDCGSELTLDEIFRLKIRSLHSVVYSAGRSDKSGCYLRTALKSGGEGMYFYGLGDEFHVQYDTGRGKRLKIFVLREIVEVTPGRIYEVVFATGEGERITRQYERGFPREFDIVQNINR